ncbi:hypothetical protein HELRODRAFT_121365, partial [Helobdella robusta]|uniref:Uncharacterized protein n=1 Tax=Helobdella robusta TaxID=6412 RepID=T1EGR5_HELRO
HQYYIDQHLLSCTNDFRDLGVIVDSKFNFNAHINNITHKASSRARLIVKCFTSKNKDLLVKAFCSYVRPLIEYCSPLWNPHYKYQITKIENVQRR